MKKLQGWFNPEALRIFESLKSERGMILDQSDIAMMMLEGPMEPGSFDKPTITLILIHELNGGVPLIKSLRR
jgi:hypothetical protein